MKTFKPFDKVLYKLYPESCWTPSFYQFNSRGKHFVINENRSIEDNLIIPYEGNEYLVGTTNEPEEGIIIKGGEFIIGSNHPNEMSVGLGRITMFSIIVNSNIMTTDGRYSYCIPMSKYNPDNLAETRKWILTVKNGKLVKLNK